MRSVCHLHSLGLSRQASDAKLCRPVVLLLPCEVNPVRFKGCRGLLTCKCALYCNLSRSLEVTVKILGRNLKSNPWSAQGPVPVLYHILLLKHPGLQKQCAIQPKGKPWAIGIQSVATAMKTASTGETIVKIRTGSITTTYVFILILITVIVTHNWFGLHSTLTLFAFSFVPVFVILFV